jgi:starch synthase
MDILFVGGELAPMVRRSDAADVIASLSKALRALGHRVTIALPRFPAIERAGVLVARRLSPLVLGGGVGPTTEVVLYDGRLGSGADLLLVDVPGGLDRPDGGDAASWATFARAVAAIVVERSRGEAPFEVVHGHDWAAGAALYLVKEAARRGDLASPVSTVLTIHDIAGQGAFGREAVAALGLDDSHFTPERLEFWGLASFLKAGLLSADAVTTVSETYARELGTAERGERMDGLVRALSAGGIGGSSKNGVIGVVSGVDHAVENPATDPALAARYDADDPSPKGRCKSALAQELGLEIDPERPSVGIVVRAGHRGGAEALLTALPKLLRLDATIVVAATAVEDERLAERIEEAVAREPERAAWLARPTDAQLRRLLAGSDLLALADARAALRRGTRRGPRRRNRRHRVRSRRGPRLGHGLPVRSPRRREPRGRGVARRGGDALAPLERRPPPRDAHRPRLGASGASLHRAVSQPLARRGHRGDLARGEPLTREPRCAPARTRPFGGSAPAAAPVWASRRS